MTLSLLKNKLESLKEASLYRSRFSFMHKQGASLSTSQKSFISFVSNDYLGLSGHPEVVAAFHKAASQYGVGSSSSPLLGGYSSHHKSLEEELADFTNQPRALLLSSGFAANLCAITSLISKNDEIFADRLSHASLIDGSLFSSAMVQRYPHRDCFILDKKLQNNSNKQRWIVTEGVFSMDGTISPLNHLATLANSHACNLILDDAHGIGVLGDKGKGVIEFMRTSPRDITVLTGSFGKAFGTFGGFIAGSDEIIEAFIQIGRPYIYSCSLPVAVAAATRSSLQLIQAASDHRAYLQELIHYFQQVSSQLKLAVLPSQTPIQLIMIGNNAKTIAISTALKEKGILVGAIRPPTVPPNTSRLRITLTIHHTKEHINRLLGYLSGLYLATK